jgi:AraC-like DNA-binding protein
VSYREHPAPAALAPWLQCTWERAPEAAELVRVLPDGCIDVVWTQDAGAQLVGPNTTAFLSEVPAGHRVVGARMAPGAAPALLGLTAPDVRDARSPLEAVIGDDGRRLGEALEGGGDPLGILCDWLARRAAGAAAPDPLVGEAVARLSRPRPQRLAGMAADIGVSERALRRRVTAVVGYGPKRLARILRLRRALELSREGEGLAGAAFLAGYVDQAHLSHDCRELAGVPPSALLPG